MTGDFRLAIPAVVAWIAAALLIAFPGVPLWIVIGTWVIAVALVATRRRVLVAVGVSCAAVALVCTLVGMRAGERHPQFLDEAASSARQVTLEAVTTSTIHPSDDHFAATVSTVTIGKQQFTASVPVLIFTASNERIGIGSTVSIQGTLQSAANEDDIAYLLFAHSPPQVVAEPPWYLSWGDELRSRFADAASRLPGDGAALLPGLAIGDTSAVSTDLNDAMKASSLSHLTAVSGANCAVVVGLATLASAAMGARRGVRIGIAVAVLVGFVVLVTPEPSVLRAGVMAALVLAASLSGRPTRGVPILAAAVLILIAIDPWLSRNYGFVLSVLATGALLTLAGPLARLMARWLPLPLATVLAVPLAAQLACQPALILLNSSIPLYGIVANVLAEPAAPIATVLGLVACVLAAVWPPLGQVVAWVAWVPAAWIGAVARFFAGLPGHSVPWLAGVPGLALLAILTAAGVAAVLVKARRVRAVAASVVVLLIVGMGAATIGTSVTQQLNRPTDWQIAACDIGQGDAVLVRSAGQIALIDTGPDPAPLTACLDVLGIDRINLLILSHYDLDHVGGTDAVLGRVDTAMVGPTGGSNDERLLADLQARGAVIENGTRGMTGTLGQLGWTVLWPRADLGPIEPGNDASVTVAFAPVEACVCLTSLFTGDLGQVGQSMILSAGPVPKVDVIKVAHHGSANQEPRFYEAAGATVGVVSVGIDNDYGHPTQSLLEILKAVGTAADRTDQHGMILLSSDGAGGVTVWTQRDTGDG